MLTLDEYQMAFCQASPDANLRLLAPAGCGKTSALLHRSRELALNGKGNPRFLLVTFTKSAEQELKVRLASEDAFAAIREQTTVTTLNAYGFRRLREEHRSPRLLKTNGDYHFAMYNQLRPVWSVDEYIEPVVTQRGSNPRLLMTVVDNLKSMGFDHERDKDFKSFQRRIDKLERQGLHGRISEQFDLLTRLGVLSPVGEDLSTSRRDFYQRFFKFWRKATARLLEEATFTFEDQKYWFYLNLKSLRESNVARPRGVARYTHILVDEFQDINPLDLALIQAIRERHQASITIVGDDDQAIFEWRGASPEYILKPEKHFDVPFTTCKLEVNYRSPANIVSASQLMIKNNTNRVSKKVRAIEGAHSAEIDIKRIPDINTQLQYVTEIARSTQPGTIAVISRKRSQLIPYEVHFASDGAPFRTAEDLDVFSSKAFVDLIYLVEVWDRSNRPQRPSQSINEAIGICNLIRHRPFSKANDQSMRKHLAKAAPRSTCEAVAAIIEYSGDKINGKPPAQLHGAASRFIETTRLADAIRTIASQFDGLKFDYEKAEDDVFFTAPPLEQLADLIEYEDMTADDFIARIEEVQQKTKEFNSFEEDQNEMLSEQERPLHLMTATRAKGKEFDTVILLGVAEGIWPLQRIIEAQNIQQMEAERRLFYVAFTRARHRVVALVNSNDAPISRFLEEAGLLRSRSSRKSPAGV